MRFWQNLVKNIQVNIRVYNFGALAGQSWLLTDEGPKQVQELENQPCTLLVQGKQVPIDGFQNIGQKEMLNVQFYRGQTITCTENIEFFIYGAKLNDQKLAAKDLIPRTVDLETQKVIKKGVKIYISEAQSEIKLPINQDLQDYGKIVGWVVGDGTYQHGVQAVIYFFDQDLQSEAKTQAKLAWNIINRLQPTDYHQATIPTGPRYYPTEGRHVIKSVKIQRLCEGLIYSGSKTILPSLEMLPYSFHLGFIKAFFAADGCVYEHKKNAECTVSLSNTNLYNLTAMQRILQRYGIMSSITQDRKAGTTKIVNKVCKRKDSFRLSIYSRSLIKFSQIFGFDCKRKSELLNELIQKYQRKMKGRPSHFTSECKQKVFVEQQMGYQLLGSNRQIEVNGILIQINE